MKRMLIFITYFSLIAFLNLSCISDSEVDRSEGFKWENSTPENEGLNKELINTGYQEADSKGFIYAIVIIRNGKIASEKYFAGRNQNSYQTIRSVSKSYLSAIYGIAIDKGLIKLDQKVIDFFPEYKSNVTDSRINQITIDHLLKMRAGIKGDQEFYFTFTSSSDWVKTILSSSLLFDPGTKMTYTTAGTHLLSAVLTKAVGKTTKEFARENLFDPTGIVLRDWLRDPQGYFFGGNDIYLTPRDMAVLGLIYMNKGKLNNVQIVPEDWVNNSIVTYSGTSAGSWGRMSKIGYGLLWWIGEIARQKVYTGIGHGGQFVCCVPELNMIIATQSYPNSDWTQADIQERAVIDIISEYIIKAAL